MLQRLSFESPSERNIHGVGLKASAGGKQYAKTRVLILVLILLSPKIPAKTKIRANNISTFDL
jgi:hypothetical protein